MTWAVLVAGRYQLAARKKQCKMVVNYLINGLGAVWSECDESRYASTGLEMF